VMNLALYLLCRHNTTGPAGRVFDSVSPDIVGAIFAGGALTGTDASNFNTRLSTYMSAINAPPVTTSYLDGLHQFSSTSGTSLVMPAFDTNSTNTIVLLAVLCNGGPTTTVTSSGLTWTKRAEVQSSASNLTVALWYAKASSALSGHVITINQTSSNFMEGTVWAYKNCNFANPFDSNGAIPATVTNSNTMPTYTTSNASDILIFLCRYGGSAADIAYTGAPGWLQPLSGSSISGNHLILHKYVYATQSGSSAVMPFSYQSTGSQCAIADAIRIT